MADRRRAARPPRAADPRAGAGRPRRRLDRHRVRGDRGPGRARRALRRPARGPGRLRPAHAARRAGASSGSPRTGIPASAGPTRSRCSRPRRPGSSGPARYSGPGPVRRAATGSTSTRPSSGGSRPPSCASSWPGWPGCPDVDGDRRGAARGTAALAVPGAVRRRPVRGAGPAPAPLPRRRRPRRLPDHRGAGRAGRAGAALARGRRRRRVDRLHRGGDHHPAGPARAADVEPRACGPAATCPRSRRPGPSGGPAAATGRSRAPASGRSIRRPPTRWWRPWRTSPRCGRGRRCWTSTPGSGCSAARWRPRSGPDGRVVCVESDAAACAAADANLADLPQAEVWQGEVDAEGLTGLLDELGAAPDVVVLDPPRAGAGPGGEPAARRRPARGRSSTSPATRPRWPGTSPPSARPGYRLAGLRAFDAFPMTAHVECVALLVRGLSVPGGRDGLVGVHPLPSGCAHVGIRLGHHRQRRRVAAGRRQHQAARRTVGTPAG